MPIPLKKEKALPIHYLYNIICTLYIIRMLNCVRDVDNRNAPL